MGKKDNNTNNKEPAKKAGTGNQLPPRTQQQQRLIRNQGNLSSATSQRTTGGQQPSTTARASGNNQSPIQPTQLQFSTPSIGTHGTSNLVTNSRGYQRNHTGGNTGLRTASIAAFPTPPEFHDTPNRLVPPPDHQRRRNNHIENTLILNDVRMPVTPFAAAATVELQGQDEPTLPDGRIPMTYDEDLESSNPTNGESYHRNIGNEDTDEVERLGLNHQGYAEGNQRSIRRQPRTQLPAKNNNPRKTNRKK